MLGKKDKEPVSEHLSLAEVLDYIGKISYKDWFLVPDLAESMMAGVAMGDAVKGSDEVLVVEVLYNTADSRTPGANAQVQGRIAIVPSAFADVGELQGYVLANLIRLEAHESREYYLVRGERPFDPHTDEGNAEWSKRQPTLCTIATAEGNAKTESDPLAFFKDTSYLKAA